MRSALGRYCVYLSPDYQDISPRSVKMKTLHIRRVLEVDKLDLMDRRQQEQDVFPLCHKIFVGRGNGRPCSGDGKGYHFSTGKRS